jgi:hypothetical protein
MTADLVQVTFQFGDATEIRYLEVAPNLGDRVEELTGHDWLVSDVVEEDERHTYRVDCVRYVSPRLPAPAAGSPPG